METARVVDEVHARIWLRSSEEQPYQWALAVMTPMTESVRIEGFGYLRKCKARILSCLFIFVLVGS